MPLNRWGWESSRLWGQAASTVGTFQCTRLLRVCSSPLFFDLIRSLRRFVDFECSIQFLRIILFVLFLLWIQISTWRTFWTNSLVQGSSISFSASDSVYGGCARVEESRILAKAFRSDYPNFFDSLVWTHSSFNSRHSEGLEAVAFPLEGESIEWSWWDWISPRMSEDKSLFSPKFNFIKFLWGLTFRFRGRKVCSRVKLDPNQFKKAEENKRKSYRNCVLSSSATSSS